MSCLPESTYAFYVDGELAPDEARAVQAHLIQCQRCRGLIVALEEEAQTLAAHFKGLAPESMHRVPPTARARGLVFGLIPALAAVSLAAAVLGWLFEQRLPTGFSWLSPLSLFGVYEMAFDTIFTLRTVAPALFDLGIAVGATAGAAALLTFLGSALLRAVSDPGRLAGLALAAGAAGLSAQPSEALDLRWEQEVVEVSAGETVDDTLVASGETIDIDGTVRGDVVAFAERVTIRGRVEGNVYAGAREVLVTGVIDGSLHMGCEQCTLEGEVTRSVYAGAERVSLSEGGRVGRDATVFGESVFADGRIDRDLFAAGERVEVRGTIERSVRIHGRRLTVFDEARIGGDLLIEITDDGEADVGSGAQVGGETTETIAEHEMHDRRSPWMRGSFYLRSFVFVTSAFLVGLVLHALLPGLFTGRLETGGDFLRCLGYGFVALVVTPIALLLCAVTVVGIPIAILGVFVYLTVLFVSTVLVASLVGSAITGADPEGSHGFGVALLLGLVLVVAVMNLPWVGGVLRLLVGLVGMGLFLTSAYETWRSRGAGEYV